MHQKRHSSISKASRKTRQISCWEKVRNQSYADELVKKLMVKYSCKNGQSWIHNSHGCASTTTRDCFNHYRIQRIRPCAWRYVRNSFCCGNGSHLLSWSHMQVASRQAPSLRYLVNFEPVKVSCVTCLQWQGKWVPMYELTDDQSLNIRYCRLLSFQ